MIAKRVVLREVAERDIEAAARFYVREGGRPLALRFLDDAARTFAAIGRAPAIGLPRYAHQLSISGLRTRKLRRFPFLIVYREEEDHVDVWRTLHGKRDIPAWLSEAVD